MSTGHKHSIMKTMQINFKGSEKFKMNIAYSKTMVSCEVYMDHVKSTSIVEVDSDEVDFESEYDILKDIPMYLKMYIEMSADTKLQFIERLEEKYHTTIFGAREIIFNRKINSQLKELIDNLEFTFTEE